jgi:hypothetical protein
VQRASDQLGMVRSILSGKDGRRRITVVAVFLVGLVLGRELQRRQEAAAAEKRQAEDDTAEGKHTHGFDEGYCAAVAAAPGARSWAVVASHHRRQQPELMWRPDTPAVVHPNCPMHPMLDTLHPCGHKSTEIQRQRMACPRPAAAVLQAPPPKVSSSSRRRRSAKKPAANNAIIPISQPNAKMPTGSVLEKLLDPATCTYSSQRTHTKTSRHKQSSRMTKAV